VPTATFPVKRSDRRQLRRGDKITFVLDQPDKPRRIIPGAEVRKVTRRMLWLQSPHYTSITGWPLAWITAIVTEGEDE